MNKQSEIDMALENLQNLHAWVENQRSNLLIINELGRRQSAAYPQKPDADPEASADQ